MEQITNYVKPELIVVAIALRDLCVCHLYLRDRPGYCTGNLYSDYTGNTDCRSFYIREPDCKTGK